MSACCHDVDECEHQREKRLAGKRADPKKCNPVAWCDEMRQAIVARVVQRPDYRNDELWQHNKLLKKCPYCGEKL